ncbi:elongation factor G [Desulfoluna limicola]|uniref:Elongation factor G n=1 Tax=Desulfoluna limicola TaxID=2810562 RepID=A0ABN6EZP8_9BACT|nr:elongation factor G [Desulfoluna limicola]BCS95779.1 elongation factor G [Desulfoluna limicola]
MKLSSDKLKNVALAAHGGAGKTSLAEALIFNSGATNRLGRVEEGNSVMDYTEEEQRRTASLSSAFYQYEWKKHIISLIDTPGDKNFFSDTKTCMPAADAAVIVIDACSGADIRTEQAALFAGDNNIPAIGFINKVDHERANFRQAFDSAVDTLKPKPILIQLPIGEKETFKGVVDLIANKAYSFTDGKAAPMDIPADMADDVESERAELIENIAEADDELLERYLEGDEIKDSELIAALRNGIKARQFMPVLCGSATANIGVTLLADFIVEGLPSPLERAPFPAADGGSVAFDSEAPFAGYVFKTIVDPYAGRLSLIKIVAGKLGKDGNLYNTNKDSKERYSQLLYLAGKEQKPIDYAEAGAIVAVAKLKETFTGDTLCDENKKVTLAGTAPIAPVISFAVEAAKQGDEDKVFSSLTRLQEEDPSLGLDRIAETKEILLNGTGMVHVEATIEKLKRKFNLEVVIKPPKVPYRETVRKKVRVQGKHKKQTGGHGQYGDCWIVLEPQERGAGFEFVDAIVGGVIPKTYIPAVEKGIIESSGKGVLAGFPCVDFRVTLDYGSFHAVDSSEMAFKMAGSLAFKKACEESGGVLLEPVMKVSVVVPDDFTGDIMGDLNSRRGRVLGMESEGKYQVVNAHVPMAEILTYAPDLNSMTGGRGTFSREFSHYDEVPGDISKKVLEKILAEKEE